MQYISHSASGYAPEAYVFIKNLEQVYLLTSIYVPWSFVLSSKSTNKNSYRTGLNECSLHGKIDIYVASIVSFACVLYTTLYSVHVQLALRIEQINFAIRRCTPCTIDFSQDF